MRIVIASDHAGLSLKAEVVKAYTKLGHQVMDLGPNTADSVDFPDYATKVARAVQAPGAPEGADLGVLVCGTGIGMSIAANKHKGIRAALCTTEFEARATRQHNDANVLCLGERVVGLGLGVAIAEAFIGATFEGGRHTRRVEKLTQIEQSNS